MGVRDCVGHPCVIAVGRERDTHTHTTTTLVFVIYTMGGIESTQQPERVAQGTVASAAFTR